MDVEVVILGVLVNIGKLHMIQTNLNKGGTIHIEKYMTYEVYKWAIHMWVHAGSNPTCADHCKELISALSCSLNDVK